jgi:CBS domain containing-hemolysin-like protein
MLGGMQILCEIYAPQSLTAEDLMEPTYFIPETMTLWTALHELRKRRLHMAIVVDEYGGTAGLVTFEDILEQVLYLDVSDEMICAYVMFAILPGRW